MDLWLDSKPQRLEQEVEVGAIPMEIWHGDLVPRDHSRFEFQVTYRKVKSSRLSRLVAHFHIFRLLMKGNFDAYVLWHLDKMVQNWIVDRYTSRDFKVNYSLQFIMVMGYFYSFSGFSDPSKICLHLPFTQEVRL